jgi:hypothetical protein
MIHINSVNGDDKDERPSEEAGHEELISIIETQVKTKSPKEINELASSLDKKNYSKPGWRDIVAKLTDSGLIIHGSENQINKFDESLVSHYANSSI